jgi:hypothetical protein
MFSNNMMSKYRRNENKLRENGISNEVVNASMV